MNVVHTQIITFLFVKNKTALSQHGLDDNRTNARANCHNVRRKKTCVVRVHKLTQQMQQK